MRITELHSNWTFRNATAHVGFKRGNEPPNLWREASVPGSIHDDLIAAGIIADPFEKIHELGCQWVAEQDWEYRTTFEWSPENSLPLRALRFEGLDTVCRVFLNDVEIAAHDNFFLPLEIDVSERLRAGSNELRVRFDSSVRVGMERREAYFAKEGIAHDTNLFDERAFVRKPGYMSGWDWGPRLISCGFWKPVRLLEYDARILSFTVFQERQENGSYRVWSQTALTGNAELKTEFDGSTYEGDFDVIVDSPRLWWPNGEGEPHLYSATARLSTGQTIEKKIGLRTIRLLQEDDALGTSFEFEVNGRKVYIRGANWIPNDNFPARITGDDFLREVDACRKLGMNMLRVWGGGMYEQDGFYDACDALGMMVWQDFPHGCSYYPDDEEAQRVGAIEAEHHIRRLADRASLAIWCGNNETDVMWAGPWGGPEKAPKRYYGDNLYATTYPNACAAIDPSRPYIRSSPIGGQKDGKAWGDMHYWDVWHGRGDWHYYADSLTRFSSEFGFVSSCTPGAWDRADVPIEGSKASDSQVRWHDKTGKPWDVYRGFAELHYPPAKDLSEWIYTSQLNQRDALRFGIEHYRTNAYCRGTLIWQFNDCWPVESWAVEDYARRIKPAGFELARLYAAAMVSLEVSESELIVRAANDGAESRRDTVEVNFFGVDGTKVGCESFTINLAHGERQEIARISLSDKSRSQTVVRAAFASDPASATWRTLSEPKDMEWAAPKLTLAGGHLKVEGLAYDLVLNGDVRVEGQSLPGEKAVCLVNESVALAEVGDSLQGRSMAGAFTCRA